MPKARLGKMRRSLTPRETVVEIPFPINGVDQSRPRSELDALSCHEAQNVRPFPPFSDKIAGGKRPGTRRAFTSATTPSTNQPNTILGLHAIPGLGASSAALQDLSYIYPTANQSSYPIPTGSWTGGFADIDDVHGTPDDTNYVATQVSVQGEPGPVPPGFRQSEMRWTLGAGAATPVTGTGITAFIRYRWDWPSGITTPSGTASAESGASEQADPFGDPTSLVEMATAPEVEDAATLQLDTFCAWRLTITVYYDSTGSGNWVALESVEVTNPPTVEDWFEIEHNITDISAVPAACWTNSARLAIGVKVEENGQCGNPFFQLSFAHLGWLTGGTVPPGPAPTASTLLILLDDKCYVSSLATDNLNTPATSTGLVRQFPSIAYYNNIWYVVDGGATKTITNTNPPVVADWTASTAGTIPANCRLVAAWRNRAVLSRQEGVANGETFWFMSAIGDFNDWDYAGNTDKPAELAAVAGVNKFLGTPADAVTALIPWNDDLFVFGCASSMWRLEGDPGYGGTLMCITRQTGVLGDRAWCFDEFGRLWFVGSSGLYMLERGGQPINVSGRKLYRHLDRLDAAQTLIQLVYDAFSKTIHIFLSPISQAGSRSGMRHIVYDIATESFWFDVYPVRFGPYAVCRLTGASDDDRRFLMGGTDGHIRRPFDGGKLGSDGLFSPTGTSRYGTGDDMKRDGTSIAGLTTAIESSVWFPPIVAPAGEQEIMITELIAYGTDNNLPLALPLGPVQWHWLVADSAATVSEATPASSARATGYWFGPANYGQQEPVGLREAGGAHQLVMRQNSATQSWAMDMVVAKFVPAGRRR